MNSFHYAALGTLSALLLSCAHRTEGKLMAPSLEYQNNNGQLMQEYLRYVDGDCVKDRTIERYNHEGELVHYELDLGNDGLIEKVWNEGEPWEITASVQRERECEEE